MSAEAQAWFIYADENLAVAELARENGYFNACLQNAQQAVEKYIKAGLLAKNIAILKTHSIEALNLSLQEAGVKTDLTDEDCDLLDTIYIPSKYPTQSVLPDFEPDQEISKTCIDLAKKVREALSSQEGLDPTNPVTLPACVKKQPKAEGAVCKKKRCTCQCEGNRDE